VSDKTQKTVRIKWIRSGIGFTYHQKRIVRSLGLRKLNQEVERPDTPQIRGLVAKVPHLVTIVEAPKTPAWKLVPEYTIHAPAAAPAKPVETPGESPAVEAEKIEAPALPVAPASSPAEELGDAAEDATTAKSGIQRHAEIARSAQEDSKPADPSGEGGEP
jgi:large subunit ribosomal protein L30